MSRVSTRHRTAFVTGASSGLGRAFTEMLLAEGVAVWGTARDAARLAGFNSAAFTPVVLDLAKPAEAEAAFKAAQAKAGGAFDLVIANAGYGLFGAFTAVDFPAWQAQLEAMLPGTLRLAHAAWSPMLARNHGCLVNVSSLAAEFPLPFMSGYNVAKAGLSAFSESLLFESRGTAVTVIDFRPGDYRTAFNQRMDTGTFAASDSRIATAWRALEHKLAHAPDPRRAAADLRAALRRGRRGVVRSGSFFQAVIAPLVARFVPACWVRAATARYFGVS